MRRLACFLIFLSLAVSTLLIGCSEDEEVVIEYWTHADVRREALEERLIGEFEKEYPHIKVERRILSSYEMIEKVPSSIEAGVGPVLFNLPSEEISSLLLSSALDPVDDSVVDTSLFIDGAFDAVTLDGVIYGIPREYTNWCLYVNKAMLDAAGLGQPRTWEDIAEIAKALSTYDGGVIERRAFDFRYPYYLNFFVPMVEQLGGSLIGPDGTYIYGDEAWAEALAFMREWGPLGSNLGSPTLVNARTIFTDEEIAMCLSGLYQEERLRDSNPSFYDSGRWEVLPFPVFEDSVASVSSASYIHYFLVNADRSAAERRAGWLLASYLTDHASEYLDKVGLLVPLRSIMEGDGVLSKPYGDVFLSELERSRPIYSGEYASEIQLLIGEAVEGVMLQGVEPEKAIASLRASVSYLFSK